MKPIYFLVLVSLALIYLSRSQYGYLKNIELGLAVLFLVICGIYWIYDRFWGNKRK